MTIPTPSAQTTFLAEGAIDRVSEIIQQLQARRPFIVLDETAYKLSGAETMLQPVLDRVATCKFTGFDLNPKLEDVQRGLQQIGDHRADLVIALGGGSAIDLGKMIGAFSCQPAAPQAIVTGQTEIQCSGLPLIAIPTTAGTGSEATHFAVAYVNGQKHSVAHRSLLPAFAIVDPLLTASLPPKITAATGLDAFCQAVESIWAVGATDVSIGYAADAVRIAWRQLFIATTAGTAESRFGMCQAANLAGKAINISKTTASHALSYKLTSDYGIPHGIAVAITLSRMLEYNSQVTDDDCNDPRGADHVLQRIDLVVDLLGASGVSDACSRIDRFINGLGCPCSLAGAGIRGPEKLAAIVASVNRQRMSNNPRTATSQALLERFASGA